jgi:hypothetical protein
VDVGGMTVVVHAVIDRGRGTDLLRVFVTGRPEGNEEGIL